MHPDLLRIPNSLFYDNKIESCYKIDKNSVFMTKSPFLFINCDEYEEKISNSYFNSGEVKIVVGLL
jgi:superfamily I DNA and/or RNA helicase